MLVGMDVHKKETVAFVVRETIQSGELVRVPTTPEGLEELLRIASGAKFVLEASTSGKAVAKWLRNREADVDMVAADVLQAHMRKAKSDRLDARDLARIGLLGDYRTCYIPTAYEEEVRSLTRHIRDTREKIVELKNQVKAIAQRNLVREPKGDLEKENVREHWKALKVPLMDQRALAGKLRLLGVAVSEREDAMVDLCHLVREDSNIPPLLAIKGVDTYTAAAISSHCGDFTRFANAKKIASYSGLVPRLTQSGEKSRHGHITRSGPNLLRHVLIEAAHHVVKSPGRLRNKYLRIKQRAGAGKAIVATARTLITIIWRMRTTNTPYHEASDPHAAAKNWRLQKVATLREQDQRQEAARLLRISDIARAHQAWARGTSRTIA